MADGLVDVAVGADATPATPILAGWTVGVTAARRADELGGLLERRGARVVHAPAIRIVPLPDDAELFEATRSVAARPLDLAVATTGIGFRGWIEAADGWGLGDTLRKRLGTAYVLCRGPKARGAVRAAGLVDAWSPASESSSEVLSHLLAEHELMGKRIAVQLHGEPLPDFIDALEAAGAEVVPVPVYRWVPPDDVGPLHRLVEQILTGAVDAVTFTSAPAVASVLRVAADDGVEEALLEALRTRVLPFCVGPVTAAPLDRREVRTVQPDRARIGALVREVCAVLPQRALHLPVAGHRVEVRGSAVLVDGRLVPLPPVPMALLNALARHPGQVVPHADLLRAAPGDGSEEQRVETAVGRLRTSLGDPRFIEIVGERGYRLACDPEQEPADSETGR